MTAAAGTNQFISVHPYELKFIFELEKPSYCDLKVVNKTRHHVAFKVKTTSPKKYFVRSNTGIIQPWDSCIIRGFIFLALSRKFYILLKLQSFESKSRHVLGLQSVTTSFKQLYATTQKNEKRKLGATTCATHSSLLYKVPCCLIKLLQSFTNFLVNLSKKLTVGFLVTLQAQQEYPPNMQCKDKFMIQGTVVPPHSDVDELPPDAFNKDSGKMIEECKLRVVCINPASDQRNTGDFALHDSTYNPDTDSTLQRLKEERDAAAQRTAQLQQELDMLKRRRYRRSDPGFSFKFAIFVGIIGMLVGLLLNLSSSSP